ncbi:MAG: tetratricopeptide repeat protein [Desulfovibrio sp.]|nr:tetratricopeptide repeat protein [Desulfovibrio sp.]
MLSERQIARLLDIANLACHKGMVREARAIFSAVLALQPDFAPAQIGLAFSHIVVDAFDEAQAILEGVLSRDAGDADALAMLGLTHMLAGRRDAAEEAFALISNESTAASMARVIMEAG